MRIRDVIAQLQEIERTYGSDTEVHCPTHADRGLTVPVNTIVYGERMVYTLGRSYPIAKPVVTIA